MGPYLATVIQTKCNFTYSINTIERARLISNFTSKSTILYTLEWNMEPYIRLHSHKYLTSYCVIEIKMCANYYSNQNEKRYFFMIFCEYFKLLIAPCFNIMRGIGKVLTVVSSIPPLASTTAIKIRKCMFIDLWWFLCWNNSMVKSLTPLWGV